MSEIRYALRTLIKRPGPTLVVIVTLGVAIGSATMIYSVIDLVWHFIPAPNQDASGLCRLDRHARRAGGGRHAQRRPAHSGFNSRPRRLVARGRRRSSSWPASRWARPASPASTCRCASRRSASRQTCPTCGASRPPSVDAFRAEERSGRIDASDPALARILAATVLGEPWRPRTDDAPRRRAAHDRRRPSRAKPEPGSSRTPRSSRRSTLDPLRAARDQRDVIVTGRLKPGVTREQADGRTRDHRPSTASRTSRHQPADRRGRRCRSSKHPGFNVRILLTILGLIGLLVVVVACANVASVIVAQSLARRHELAVHAALGATRADRVRRLDDRERASCRRPQASSGCCSPRGASPRLRWLGGNAFGFADMQMNGRVLAAGLLIAGATPTGLRAAARRCACRPRSTGAERRHSRSRRHASRPSPAER